MTRSCGGTIEHCGTTFLFFVTLSALQLLVSCAPQHPHDMQRVDSLRYQAEDFVKAQSLMGYNAGVFGTRSNEDSLYNANAQLFTTGNIALVRRAKRDEDDPVQKMRLLYFHRFLTTEYIARHLAPITDSIANIEASAALSVGGKTVLYRQIAGMLSNEPSRDRREILYRACDYLLDSLNVLHRRANVVAHRLAVELDYPSFNAMMDDVKGYSLDSLKEVASRVLKETDSLYTSLLANALKEYLHLEPADFHRYDTGFLFRNSRFDAFFPAAAMMPTLKTTYLALGVDLSTQKNLTIDDVDRPSKNPRAFCSAISVPDDIRLSIKPVGGFDDYAALFHEMGHAEHYAHTREHAMEFKYLGEPTVTETFAFLSEYVLTNQAWLRSRNIMPTPVLKDYLRFQVFYRLYYVRRYCAKLLYEMQLHGGVADPGPLYAELLSSATRYQRDPSDAKRYLVDVDANFYSAGYLRAWFLESQLNARLTHDFGFNWFEHPQAGVYLRTLWAQGDRQDGNDLVQSLGYASIAPDAWIAEMRAMVRFSMK